MQLASMASLTGKGLALQKSQKLRLRRCPLDFGLNLGNLQAVKNEMQLEGIQEYAFGSTAVAKEQQCTEVSLRVRMRACQCPCPVSL